MWVFMALAALVGFLQGEESPVLAAGGCGNTQNKVFDPKEACMKLLILGGGDS